MNLFFNFFKY